MAKEAKNKGFIGVFDSGFGGLEILREIVRENPKYNYVYLGDTARVPYGGKTKEAIYNFTLEAVEYLFKKGAELIILACNTASSEALRKLQRGYLMRKYPQRRILGVIVPAVEEVAEMAEKGMVRKVGVIGTKRTIDSGAFLREIKKRNKKIQVFQNSCPLLVPLIENRAGDDILEMAISRCLKPLLGKKIDYLILACTHYGLIEKKIKKIVGKNILVISEGKIVARKLKDYLFRHKEIEKKLAKNGRIEFLTTDLSDNFQTLGSCYFGRKIKVKKVSLLD